MESNRVWVVEWVDTRARSLAARLIAGRLLPEGCDVEEWHVPRVELTFVSFGVVGRNRQRQQLQQREDRILMLILQLAMLDWFDWLGLGYSEVARAPEHYTPEVRCDGGGGESDITPSFRRLTDN